MRRLLPHNEYHRLIGPVQALFGTDKLPPSPEVAPYCAVEEDEDGEIIGFLFLQLAFHLEPFGSMGGVSFSGLREIIDEALTNMPGLVYYLHSDNPIGTAKFISKGFIPKGTMFVGSPEV